MERTNSSIYDLVEVVGGQVSSGRSGRLGEEEGDRVKGWREALYGMRIDRMRLLSALVLKSIDIERSTSRERKRRRA